MVRRDGYIEFYLMDTKKKAYNNGYKQLGFKCLTEK